MNLTLKRRRQVGEATLGDLYVDGVFECFTLEDVVRGTAETIVEIKIAGRTAIPAGRYEIRITPSDRARSGTLWSPRPDASLPLLMNVPDFAGIRIHAGNRATDTAGCILVGRVQQDDMIGASRAALTALMTKLEEGLGRGAVFITIEDIEASA